MTFIKILAWVTLSGTALAAHADCVRRGVETLDIKEDFGAVGNGTTDDTRAFQSAFNCIKQKISSATKYGSVTLSIPKGNYLVSDLIAFAGATKPGAIVIRGVGQGKSKIVSTGGHGVFEFSIVDSTDLEIEGLGFVSKQPSGGSAIKAHPEECTEANWLTCAVHVVLRLSHISIGGQTTKDYFDYGLNSTGFKQPFVDDVHMVSPSSGGMATTCYSFGVAYMFLVRNSSCDGAAIGVENPVAGEGGYILNSTFRNVDLAIRIKVPPSDGIDLNGPTAGLIENNFVEARVRGVFISNKVGFQIVGNTFRSVAGANAFEDVVLTGTKQIIVSGNVFAGRGADRTAITLIGTGHTGKADDLANTISNNKFGEFNTGISVGQYIEKTFILDNTFSGTKNQIKDSGSGTFHRP